MIHEFFVGVYSETPPLIVSPCVLRAAIVVLVLGTVQNARVVTSEDYRLCVCAPADCFAVKVYGSAMLLTAVAQRIGE